MTAIKGRRGHFVGMNRLGRNFRQHQLGALNAGYGTYSTDTRHDYSLTI